MSYKIPNPKKENIQFVAKEELNMWRRGFTPQAEIWNGRMAMLGTGFILLFLFIWDKFL